MRLSKWFGVGIVLVLGTTGLLQRGLCQPASGGTKPRKYHYIEKTTTCKVKPGPDLQYIFLPVPPSDEYQEISNIDTHGGEILENPDSKERYVRYTIAKDGGDCAEYTLEYDYLPKTTEYTAAVVTQVFPYDTKTELFQTYTARYYDLIDTDNPTLRKASDRLWRESSDAYDYARRCFDYVDRTFVFQNNPGGWNTTSELIHHGGGDCGDLASLFITLMRIKKVPARHVVTNAHAWAEFYLERYGWIPADPTYGLFGRAASPGETSTTRIVRSHEIVYHLSTPDGQTFRNTHLNKMHVLHPSHEPYECKEQAVLEKVNPPTSGQ